MLKLQNSSFFRFCKTTAFLSARKVDFFCLFIYLFFFFSKAQNSDILHSPLYAGPGTIIPDYGSWLDIDKSKMILLCLEETSIFLLIRLAASKVIESAILYFVLQKNSGESFLPSEFCIQWNFELRNLYLVKSSIQRTVFSLVILTDVWKRTQYYETPLQRTYLFQVRYIEARLYCKTLKTQVGQLKHEMA